MQFGEPSGQRQGEEVKFCAKNKSEKQRNDLTLIKRKRYIVGLVSGDDAYFPAPPYYGRGWHATWEKQRRKYPAISGNEVVIYARDWYTAQRAANLILASAYLVQGNPPLFEQPLIARNSKEPPIKDPFERRTLRKQYRSFTDIALACAIAAKASRNSKYAYAIHKYNFSIGLYSIFSVDLEPFHSLHLSLSPFSDDHVLFSHAIIAAYSVVEELGLEIRATQQNPSKIKGRWNPVVLDDLNERLRVAKVNTRETILFTLRGPPKKTEIDRPFPVIAMAPWAHGHVRDSEVSIVDAIAHASWLRSKTAAHKANTITKSISPYDVVNVQHLARRLSLETLGFWRFHERQPH